MNKSTLYASLCLAAGLIFAGYFIGHGFSQSRNPSRIVTVKGVAQRDVIANIALWPIRFVSTDDDLSVAQSKINKSQKTIYHFLKKHDIDLDNVEVKKMAVTDLFADPYRSGPVQNRYIVEQTLMVRTEKCSTVVAASQAVGDLIASGIVLSSRGGPDSGPTFLFTELSQYKPDMIAEATAKARKAAEQFAKDSGSKIGKIRRANQGMFVILARDRAPGIYEESQMNKTIRVVSTIEYMLKD